MKQSLDFIIKGSEVTRYHTVRMLSHETVGHHSHMVAMLCWLIDPNCSRNLLIAALSHDLAEHVTGDIPSPSKRKYGIGDQVNELEDALLRSAGFNIALDAIEKRVMKLADIFQGMITCGREIELGNLKLKEIYGRYRSYAEDLVLIGRERELFDIIEEYFHGSK